MDRRPPRRGDLELQKGQSRTENMDRRPPRRGDLELQKRQSRLDIAAVDLVPKGPVAVCQRKWRVLRLVSRTRCRLAICCPLRKQARPGLQDGCGHRRGESPKDPTPIHHRFLVFPSHSGLHHNSRIAGPESFFCWTIVFLEVVDSVLSPCRDPR